MTPQNYLVLSLDEVRWVLIECPHCSTEVAFDIQSGSVPQVCPTSRHADYGAMFVGTLQRFQEDLKRLCENGERAVKIRIEVEA